MTLNNTIINANELIQADDEIQVENILEAGMEFIEGEQDISVLLSYARLCKEWGSPESEETALRKIILFELSNQDRIAALHALIDLIIRERLNYATDHEQIELSKECIQLASQVIDLLCDDHGAEWANLLSIRAARYLDLSRAGDLKAVNLASIDIENYINWLEKGTNIPRDWNKENLIAFAQIDLAETRIIKKVDFKQATSILESAIQTLEANNVGKWSTDRAYELLDKVLEMEE